MGHPAELPINAIIALIPTHARLRGLWVQTAADGTLPQGGGPVHVSAQWSSGGYASNEGADGATVGEAGERLVDKLRARFKR